MSIIRCSILVIFLLAIVRPVHAAPVSYTFVSKLSRVTFNIEHQGFIELVGTMRVAPGSFDFDVDDWGRSNAAVVLPTRSIDLGDAVWNKMMRADKNWVKLFQYPTISFKSTKVVRTDSTHGKIVGDLTIAGVTKSVVLDLKVNKIGINEVSELPSIGFTASTTLKRSEFGLDAYEDLVGDLLTLKIQIEAVQGKDTDAGHDQTAIGVD
ncbi:YceI family protein [Undibacterium sp. RuTC16W]|uniref:YceI family protein n=1 Tax=Undibacterium sp. RuTC16W TaxID=3413048 RepID=UPI003BF2929A